MRRCRLLDRPAAPAWRRAISREAIHTSLTPLLSRALTRTVKIADLRRRGARGRAMDQFILAQACSRPRCNWRDGAVSSSNRPTVKGYSIPCGRQFEIHQEWSNAPGREHGAHLARLHLARSHSPSTRPTSPVTSGRMWPSPVPTRVRSRREPPPTLP